MKATKYQQKSQIRLEDLLRRRKSSLKDFLKDRGVTTYEGLDALCKRLGVLTPNHQTFVDYVDKYISNPAAGVVIIDPAPVIDELTGDPEVELDDKFEDLQPQISITNEDESTGFEVSVVLQEALINQVKTQPRRKRQKNRKN